MLLFSYIYVIYQYPIQSSNTNITLRDFLMFGKLTFLPVSYFIFSKFITKAFFVRLACLLLNIYDIFNYINIFVIALLTFVVKSCILSSIVIS